jgi:hypothetical protein
MCNNKSTGTKMQLRRYENALRRVLVLVTVAGTVVLSWLLGQALRNATPALWLPVVSEPEPQMLYRVEAEFAGIRRFVLLPGLAPGNALTQAQLLEVMEALPAECVGHTFYTSLPAKCRTADGRLVRIGGIESNVILIPQGK